MALLKNASGGKTPRKITALRRTVIIKEPAFTAIFNESEEVIPLERSLTYPSTGNWTRQYKNITPQGWNSAACCENFLLGRCILRSFDQSRHLHSHRCEYDNRLTRSCPVDSYREKSKRSARKREKIRDSCRDFVVTGGKRKIVCVSIALPNDASLYFVTRCSLKKRDSF